MIYVRPYLIHYLWRGRKLPDMSSRTVSKRDSEIASYLLFPSGYARLIFRPPTSNKSASQGHYAMELTMRLMNVELSEAR